MSGQCYAEHGYRYRKTYAFITFGSPPAVVSCGHFGCKNRCSSSADTPRHCGCARGVSSLASCGPARHDSTATVSTTSSTAWSALVAPSAISRCRSTWWMADRTSTAMTALSARPAPPPRVRMRFARSACSGNATTSAKSAAAGRSAIRISKIDVYCNASFAQTSLAQLDAVEAMSHSPNKASAPGSRRRRHPL